MKKIGEGIYLVPIPLVGNPLKELNAYILTGKGEALVIDTGFDAPESREALYGALKELGYAMVQVRVLLTHLHSDHTGLSAEMESMGARILAGHIDGNLLNEMAGPGYLEDLGRRADWMDLKRDGIDFSSHPGYRYLPRRPIPFKALKEGDVINIGHRRLSVIDIPGHTPGHIALYEPEEGILFSGDHVLSPITPHISFWGFEWGDILQAFFDSLEKIRNLGAKIILPAHRQPITEIVARIDAIAEHHQERMEEVDRILCEQPLSVRDVAARMHWSIRANGWEEFPDAQKFFAAGEAMAHLEHAAATGLAQRFEENNIIFYQLIK